MKQQHFLPDNREQLELDWNELWFLPEQKRKFLLGKSRSFFFGKKKKKDIAASATTTEVETEISETDISKPGQIKLFAQLSRNSMILFHSSNLFSECRAKKHILEDQEIP